ncbi:putative ferredoxin--NADP(+) reductase [Gordonia polyisoprenivorans NBRC 16320 = JCM 10675]|uniref:ferredoxin--NADP(+) reductase n=2 Tax=Gordonia polyisoprenivorans TaxID=84595 RepID=A0A846WRX1_9ACTN|nr:FAD-dependent oxidoreductase [Gordonia polyisoprenivorans]GAB24228.1 putative ferredoxin--NADP(+) reductase [Gordonia polyisoprenivorans NBRC 16320 = JCM 10675]
MTAESSPALAPKIAVIGSGPSGCYTAQFLRKEMPDAEITIFEALPVPYGLVRYGVAADHQGTKAVTRQFDRMFERSGITFVGNTRVGDDIDHATMARAFDVVVLATGLTADRSLAIPCADQARVVGAGALLRLLNAYPGRYLPATDALRSNLGRSVAVVGHGNVGIDVVRLLTKTTDQLVGSDIHDEALEVLRPSPAGDVHVVGRSSAADAKFDLAMVREICALDTVTISVHGLEDTDTGATAQLLRSSAHGADRHVTDGSPTSRVHFHFRAVPTAIRTEGDKTILDVTRGGNNTGTTPIAVDTVVTAVGFCPEDTSSDDQAWNGTRLYRVGWLDRGGRGNIAENRKHSLAVVNSIVSDLRNRTPSDIHKGGLAAVASKLPSAAVDFSGWLCINEAERDRADDSRCRRKITEVDHMVTVAGPAESIRRAITASTTPEGAQF